MKKILYLSACVILFVSLASFIHKFYVGIYQINYAPEKKMLQVTSRIFVDDLNQALEKKYQKKTYLGEKEQTESDITLMKKYISENLILTVNGKPATLNYHTSELENNVMIGYFSVAGIGKIHTLGVRNKILFDLVTEQQNIIQTNVNGKKASRLLTVENPSDTFKY